MTLPLPPRWLHDNPDRVREKHGCVCQPKNRDRWYVSVRNANYSAFNGYHRTPSDYSEVRCMDCYQRWRTRARYVDTLQDAPINFPGER